MAYIQLTKHGFKSIVTQLVENINKAQGEGYYNLVFDQDLDLAKIKVKGGGTFHLTYLDEFLAIATLYGCGMWIDTEFGTNTLVLTIMKN